MKPLEVTKARNNDPKLLKALKAFVPCRDMEAVAGTCGNIQHVAEGVAPEDWNKTFCAANSAPYILARLCAGFEDLQIESCGQGSYKITWQTALVHPASGNVVTFYDYKGGISYSSNVTELNGNEEFVSDLVALLAALSNDRFPHPYDGCVVGEQA